MLNFLEEQFIYVYNTLFFFFDFKSFNYLNKKNYKNLILNLKNYIFIIGEIFYDNKFNFCVYIIYF